MATNQISKTLDKLMKDYNDLFVDISTAGIINYHYFQSPSLNNVFGGKGFALGRIHELNGHEGGGKTTIATIIASEIQKRPSKNKIVFIDFEYSFDVVHAKRLGLDITDARHGGKLFFLRPLDGESAFEVVEELVKTGEIGLIIWDSIAATPTRTQMEKEHGSADFGVQAKLFSTGLRKLNPYLVRTETPMILINQLRAKQGAGMYEDKWTTTGGKAILHYAGTRFRVSRDEDILEDGDVVGIKIKLKNQKNKTGVPKREGIIQVYFDRGLSVEEEYIRLMVDFKIIKKSGSWLICEDIGLKAQSMQKAIEFFQSRPSVFDAYKNTVNELIAQRNDLDLENEANSANDFDQFDDE